MLNHRPEITGGKIGASPLLDPVLSVADTAAVLSLGTRTIWRLIKQGKLTATKVSERRVGIKVTEINRYQTDLQKQAPAAA